MSYKPRHAERRNPGRKIALAAATAALTAVSLLAGGTPAHASESLRDRALDWAETQAGKPYVYGAAGPWSYDCSGLVMAAYKHAGVTLPHNTVAMLYSGKLVRTYHPQRGDLAFYGTGHVEMVTIWYHQTFGAHDTGTVIGYITYGYGWQPTAYYRVVG